MRRSAGLVAGVGINVHFMALVQQPRDLPQDERLGYHRKASDEHRDFQRAVHQREFKRNVGISARRRGGSRSALAQQLASDSLRADTIKSLGWIWHWVAYESRRSITRNVG